MSREGKLIAANVTGHADDEASELFVQRLYGEWTAEHQAAFETRLEKDQKFAQAWKRVEEGWASLDRHAEAPEVMRYRAEAISEVRRANSRRWYRSQGVLRIESKWKLAAAIAVLGLFGSALQLSRGGLSFFGLAPGQYRTAIGEQRIVELADHSRITMDAATRLEVRFTDESRVVRLIEGQAKFSVAKDSGRPFKVLAGDRVVVAVGTVFTVEYVDRKIHVAMLEGKVAVLSPDLPGAANSSSFSAGMNVSSSGETVSRKAEGEIFLTAGEELHVAQGRAVVTPKADIEAVTAWREGKIIFRTETLSEAASRMNRYSRLQLEIDDPALASKHISGVFEAGDTRGFVDALERHLSLTADYSDGDIVRLKAQ